MFSCCLTNGSPTNRVKNLISCIFVYNKGIKRICVCNPAHPVNKGGACNTPGRVCGHACVNVWQQPFSCTSTLQRKPMPRWKLVQPVSSSSKWSYTAVQKMQARIFHSPVFLPYFNRRTKQCRKVICRQTCHVMMPVLLIWFPPCFLLLVGKKHRLHTWAWGGKWWFFFFWGGGSYHKG